MALDAAGQSYSGTFVSTLEADASRTAKAVAKKIRASYASRG